MYNVPDEWPDTNAAGASDFGGRDLDNSHLDLDAMHRDYLAAEARADAARNDAADAERDGAAMAEVDEELDEAIRVAQVEAECAQAEYERLVAYRARRAVTPALGDPSTAARIAAHNMAAVDMVASIFERRAV